MMILSKLATAKTIIFGPVLDADGAEYTGAVVADVKISKNNGTPASLNGSATLTHKEVGIYELVLTAADISAVGALTITLSKTTYVAPPIVLNVLPANVYDSLVGGTDNLEIDLVQWLGTAAATPTVAGVPEVDITHIRGTASAGDAGYVGTDQGAINDPTAVVALSGTTMGTVNALANDSITSAALAASAVSEIQSGLSTLTAGQVNAEVLDVLNVDTFAEVGQETPAATTTIRKMLSYLYKAWRNKKTQTATQYSLYSDDAATVDQKATVSDDGTTTTVGEVSTGP